MVDLSDVPNSDVVPFGRYCSVVTVYSRHADGEDNVVCPLGGGPIRCPLFRRGSVMDDGRNILGFLVRV